MFARLSQVSRHLSRSRLPATIPSRLLEFPSQRAQLGVMTSSLSVEERSMRKIHTAACLIIGDEVLGGKVG
jgi:hypothetical protein